MPAGPRIRVPAVSLLLAVAAGVVSAAELRPGTVVAASRPADARAWAGRIDALVARNELVLRASAPDPDFPGRRHLRYEQRHGGARVLAAELVRQLDAGGGTLTVFGRLQEDLGASSAPRVSAHAAEAVAEASLGRGAMAVGEPEPFVVPLSSRAVLAWSVRARFDHRLERFLVDAATGEVVLRWDDLRYASAVGPGTGFWGDRKKVSANREAGTFRADDRLRPPALLTYDLGNDFSAADLFFRGGPLPASFVAKDADNDWKDGAVVDAHVYAGYTYDYYFERHGRRGIDGQDLTIRSLIHFAPKGVDFVNAFWDTFTNAMFYGDGNRTYGAFSGALDVVAHELTHGVTQYSWDGLPTGESGALNESFSDIMGTAVEFYFQSPGEGRLQADYWLGEDLAYDFDPPRRATRSMENPSIFCHRLIGCDPDHYSRRYVGPEDNGGVHSNAGISNQAFFLLVEGGTNRTSGRRVEGLGAANREKAEKIFYRGFTAYLTPSATFADARRATIRAAGELYGEAGREAVTVAAAWDAVGVD
jgi:Zn-dependent metalloprotease